MRGEGEMDMARQGKIRKMFPGGNTTKGYYFLFEYMIQPAVNRVYIIKGGPGTGKSSLMNFISREMTGRGYEVEHHHCATDPDSLDGLVIPDLGVALLDGTAPHAFDPKNPGIAEEIVNLAEYWDDTVIIPYKAEIMEISKRGNMHFQTAYSLLKQSKMAYDQWQWYVEEAIDPAKYNRISRLLVERMLEGITPNYDTAPQARHLLASAITPGGIVDFRQALIERDMKVFSVRGESKTLVKQLIRRAANAAEEMGLYTEQYHCPYEPDKLDMLIIPAVRTVVTNSSQPYHLDPEGLEEKPSVETVDLDICIKKGLLEQYEEEKTDALIRSRNLLEKGIEYLAKARAAHSEREKYYSAAMDFDRVDIRRREILNQILQYAEE
jgi:hypothetical protein